MVRSAAAAALASMAVSLRRRTPMTAVRLASTSRRAVASSAAGSTVRSVRRRLAACVTRARGHSFAASASAVDGRAAPPARRRSAASPGGGWSNTLSSVGRAPAARICSAASRPCSWARGSGGTSPSLKASCKLTCSASAARAQPFGDDASVHLRSVLHSAAEADLSSCTRRPSSNARLRRSPQVHSSAVGDSDDDESNAHSTGSPFPATKLSRAPKPTSSAALVHAYVRPSAAAAHSSPPALSTLSAMLTTPAFTTSATLADDSAMLQRNVAACTLRGHTELGVLNAAAASTGFWLRAYSSSLIHSGLVASPLPFLPPLPFAIALAVPALVNTRSQGRHRPP
mmetsp:Transcript_20518/g.66618  ORF Transcript_20518/g.66618 Transcript_20518/m.66618 type:complete len:343 (+) Transcript_20518:1490-2518(+)